MHCVDFVENASFKSSGNSLRSIKKKKKKKSPGGIYSGAMIQRVGLSEYFKFYTYRSFNLKSGRFT